jgi:hypothetical protein
MAEVETLTRIPLSPLRDRFFALEARGLMSRGQIARGLGWYRNAPACARVRGISRVADTGRVSRLLTQRAVGYEIAVKLCRLLAMDPFEAGV